MGPKKEAKAKEPKESQEAKTEEKPKGEGKGKKKGKEQQPKAEEAPADQAEQSQEAPAEADTAFGAGKEKGVQAPNQEEFHQRRDALNQALAAVNGKVKALTDSKLAKQNEHRKTQQHTVAIQKRLNDAATEIRVSQAEIARLDVLITNKEAERLDQRSRLQEQKRTLRFQDVESLDAAVRDLEVQRRAIPAGGRAAGALAAQQQHAKIIEQMRILNMQRDTVLRFQTEYVAAQTAAPASGEEKKQRGEAQEKLRLKRGEERDLTGQLRGAKAAENQARRAIGSVEEERKLEDERRQLERDLDRLNRSYEKQKALYDRQKSKERYETRKKERDARQAEKKDTNEDEDIFDESTKKPHAAVKARIDELTRYLQRLAPKGSLDEPAKEARDEKVEKAEDRNKGFKSKQVAAPTGTKKQTKLESYGGSEVTKGKGAAAKAGVAVASKRTPKTLIHTLDILKEFNNLRIAVPLTDDKIHEAVTALTAKRAYYEGLGDNAEAASEAPAATEASEEKADSRRGGKQRGRGKKGVATDDEAHSPTPAELRAEEQDRSKNAKKADGQAEKERNERVSADAQDKAAAKVEQRQETLRNTKAATAAVEKERNERVAADAKEKAAARDETAKERARNAKMADAQAEKERLDRIADEAVERAAAKAEGTVERDRRKRLSGHLEDQEQLRRMKEMAEEAEAKAKEEELARSKRAALADLAMEQERVARMKEDKARVEANKKAPEPAPAAETKEEETADSKEEEAAETEETGDAAAEEEAGAEEETAEAAAEEEAGAEEEAAEEEAGAEETEEAAAEEEAGAEEEEAAGEGDEEGDAEGDEEGDAEGDEEGDGEGDEEGDAEGDAEEEAAEEES